MVVERTSKILSKAFPNFYIGNPFLILIFLAAVFLFFPRTSFATPTITLNISPSTNIMSGTAITLTVTVPAGATLSPNAVVTYDTLGSTGWSDAKFLADTPNTTNSFAFTYTPPLGTYTLVASGEFMINGVQYELISPNVTLTVIDPPPPTVSLSADNTTYIVGQTVNLSANAYASWPIGMSGGNSIQKVAYTYSLNNGSAVGIGTSASSSNPYTETWTPTQAGTYTLKALAADAFSQTTTSSPVTITLTPHVPPTVSITAPSNNTSYIYPQSIPLTTTASVTAGTIRTNGVVFSYALNGSSTFTAIGAATLSSGASVIGSYAWTPPQAGSYVIKAVATDSTAATGSSTINVTVTAHQPPVVTFTAPLNNSSSVYPSSITLTANATVSAGTINTNGVVFSYATVVNNVIGSYTPIGTATLTSAASVTGSYTWTPPKAGSYVIKAVATDSTGATGSSTINLTVTPHQPPVVIFTTPLNNSSTIYPSVITLTANATVSAGVINANGVVFAYAPVVNNVVGSYSSICTPTLAAGANVNATCNWTPPANPGSSNLTYSIKATATDNTSASTISTINVTVTPHQLPTVAFTAPVTASSSIYPAPITLTANAIANGGVINANGIVFSYALNGASTFTTIGSATFASAASVTGTYAWTPPSVGSYVIKALTTDNTGKTASTTINLTVTAHQPPVVIFTAPANNSSTIYPAAIPLIANATVSAGTINTNGIVFSYATVINNVIGAYSTIGTATLTSGANVNGSYAWTPPKAGSYLIKAVATDSTGATGVSTINLTVTPHVPPTISVTTDQTTYSYPQNVQLTATATVSAGTINANGIVFSYAPVVNNVIGTYKTIGTATFSSGASVTGIYTWTSPAVGVYSVVATVTDSTSMSTKSSAATITVTPHVAPTVSFTSPVNYSGYYPTGIVLTANAIADGGTINSNGIVFSYVPVVNGLHGYNWISIGAAKLASASNVNGSYTWTPPSAGIFIIQATATDSSNTTSSTTLTIGVNPPPPPSVSITVPSNGEQYPAAPVNIVIYPNPTPSSISNAVITEVDYYLNGSSTPLAKVTSSPFSYNWNAPAGSYSLTANAIDANGAVGTSAPISVIVGSPTITVSITSPVANQSYTTAPSNITITATAASSGSATISSVAFYNGETLLGTVKSSPYTFTWNNVGVGNYNLTAVATDSNGNNATSVIVPITVAATGTSSSPTGLAVNLVGVLSNKTNILNSAGGGVIGTENSGSLGTLLSATSTVVTVNDPTPCSTGSLSCPPVSTSSSSYVQVHFFDTNKTGWVAQNSIVTLATTSSTVAAYAFITYNNPKLNLTPVVYQNLTSAQQSALTAAETALIGKKQFFIFGGKVVVIDGNTNIQVNDVADQVSMAVTDGSVNYGTALMADLSQVYLTNTCNSSGPWYNYIYCLLDNDAKVTAAKGVAFNLNTDPVMTTVNTYLTNYLSTNYPSVSGGIVKNFVTNIDLTGQNLDITPSNNLNLSDQVKVAFFNDPTTYNKTKILNSYNAIQQDILADNPTVSFYVVTDSSTDASSINDLDLVVSSQVSTQAAQVMSNIKANAKVKAMAIGSSITSTPSDLPVDQTPCYNSQTAAGSTSILPCGYQIDFVIGMRQAIMAPTVAKEIKIVKNLGIKLGYNVNIIQYQSNSYYSDPYGINFLKSLITTPGQILILNFHGDMTGQIAPVGCVYSGYSGISAVISALHGLYVQGYLNVDPSNGKGGVNPLSSFDVYPSDVSSEVCGGNAIAWGININDTNITSKALEISEACFGHAGALSKAINFVGVPDSFPNLVYYGAEDLKLLSSNLAGEGQSIQYYNTYPPTLNLSEDNSTQSINELRQFPWFLNNISDPNNFTNTIDYSDITEDTEKIIVNNLNAMNNLTIPPGCTIPTYTGSLAVGGSISNVPISCELYPYYGPGQTNSVHLYPYVSAFTYPAANASGNGQVLDVKFSDDVYQPNFVLPLSGVSGKTTAIASFKPVNNSLREFQVQLLPEIEALTPSAYLPYANNLENGSVPTEMFSVSGAYSPFSGIAMMGNSLAKYTGNDSNDSNPGDPKYHLTYYPGATYFWNYNARFDPTSGADNNTFKANIPYRLHPYVDTVTASGNQVNINFSRPVQGTAGADASSYLAVDSSQCQELPGQIFLSNTGGPYPSGQTPVFSSPATGGGVNSIQIPLNSNITLASSSSAYLKITVQNVLSYPNKFPLLSDGSTFSYSGIGSTSSTGNANKFITTPGSYTITIPCTPQPPVCSCAGKADGASDGCGGTCCVPQNPPWDQTMLNQGSMNDSHCGGVFLQNYIGYQTGVDDPPVFYGLYYKPANNCTYQYLGCLNNNYINSCNNASCYSGVDSTNTGDPQEICRYNLYECNDSTKCQSPILDCKKTS